MDYLLLANLQFLGERKISLCTKMCTAALKAMMLMKARFTRVNGSSTCSANCLPSMAPALFRCQSAMITLIGRVLTILLSTVRFQLVHEKMISWSSSNANQLFRSVHVDSLWTDIRTHGRWQHYSYWRWGLRWRFHQLHSRHRWCKQRLRVCYFGSEGARVFATIESPTLAR
jgi:hypothetical protein